MQHNRHQQTSPKKKSSFALAPTKVFGVWCWFVVHGAGMAITFNAQCLAKANSGSGEAFARIYATFILMFWAAQMT